MIYYYLIHSIIKQGVPIMNLYNILLLSAVNPPTNDKPIYIIAALCAVSLIVVILLFLTRKKGK